MLSSPPTIFRPAPFPHTLLNKVLWSYIYGMQILVGHCFQARCYLSNPCQCTFTSHRWSTTFCSLSMLYCQLNLHLYTINLLEWITPAEFMHDLCWIYKREFIPNTNNVKMLQLWKLKVGRKKCEKRDSSIKNVLRLTCKEASKTESLLYVILINSLSLPSWKETVTRQRV